MTTELRIPAGFLREANGDFSAMRLIVMLVVLITVCTWSYIVIVTKTWVPFGIGDAVTILGPLFAKAYQKGKEEGNDAGKAP